MGIPDDVPLVLWAGCVWRHGIVARAEGLHAGGFASMSLFTRDLAAWEGGGGTLAGLRANLDAREAAVSCIDPYLGWYPGYDPRAAVGERADFLRATEDDILRFADALDARHISLVAPYDGADAPLVEVVDELGGFADRAAAAGLRLQLEVVPRTKIRSLESAVALVTGVGRANLGLLLDTYNLARTGADPAALGEVPRELVFAVQLADGMREPCGGDPGFDSLHNRCQPGEGELPLADMLEPLLRNDPLPSLGPEVLRDELGGLPAELACRRCAEATRRFLRSVADR
jgi:4-hydroxyphenylpyruvate dioxygenase